nr:L-ascorbate oxidase homolog [Ipomoea batatas]
MPANPLSPRTPELLYPFSLILFMSEVYMLSCVAVSRFRFKLSRLYLDHTFGVQTGLRAVHTFSFSNSDTEIVATSANGSSPSLIALVPFLPLLSFTSAVAHTVQRMLMTLSLPQQHNPPLALHPMSKSNKVTHPTSTYKLAGKDQIGSIFLLPQLTAASTRGLAAYGPINVHSRDLIPRSRLIAPRSAAGGDGAGRKGRNYTGGRGDRTQHPCLPNSWAAIMTTSG